MWPMWAGVWTGFRATCEHDGCDQCGQGFEQCIKGCEQGCEHECKQECKQRFFFS